MTEGTESENSEPPDLDALARRYLDLWQDQWAAVAADPEVADGFSRLFGSLGQLGGQLGTAAGALMAPWMQMFAQGAGGPSPFRPPSSPAYPSAPAETSRARPPNRPADGPDSPGTASAGPASGGESDRTAELARRIAALEQQLAALASQSAPPGR